METKGKLTLWVEKERKLRKNFLLIYQSAIQLSGYHLAYQSISVVPNIYIYIYIYIDLVRALGFLFSGVDYHS